MNSCQLASLSPPEPPRVCAARWRRVALAVGLLFAVAAPARSEEPCDRLCLAPTAVAGSTAEERVALEAALARSLQTPRCPDAFVIDDVCFQDDSCLAGRAGVRDAGFVAVRAAIAAGRLSLKLVAVPVDGAVRRVERSGELLAFLADGALDPTLAACADAPAATTAASPTPAAAPETAEAPAAVADDSATKATLLPETAPQPAGDPPHVEVVAPAAPIAQSGGPAPWSTPALIGGAAVGGLGALLALGGAVALEQADLGGDAKDIALGTGWVGLGAAAVGAVVAGVGLVGIFLPADGPGPRAQ